MAYTNEQAERVLEVLEQAHRVCGMVVKGQKINSELTPIYNAINSNPSNADAAKAIIDAVLDANATEIIKVRYQVSA